MSLAAETGWITEPADGLERGATGRREACGMPRMKEIAMAAIVREIGTRTGRRLILGLAVLGLAAGACLEGNAGPRGRQGEPGSSGGGGNLDRWDDLPGLVIQILEVSGASGADGTFRAGDRIRVRFRIQNRAGENLALGDLDAGSIYVSGPSFNYQRVLPRQQDLIAASERVGGGTYAYTFAAAIPATYPAPYNDTPTFGAADGELQGQALLAGTYTVGIEAYKDYDVEGEEFRDAGNATRDFLFGGAAALEPREVVKMDNCNRCHRDLHVHSDRRRDVRNCVLCHTAGAEDGNDPGLAGGTPGVTIDFRVMIHKIHNARSLPSVLGVATNPDGTRNYAATPQPLIYTDPPDEMVDFSEHIFPQWPNLNIAMPRDQGYSALGSTERGLEDTIRMGATACDACHGDPDGAGPLTAPAQGGLAYSQPSRKACGACHDDINWDYPYTANGQTMPAGSTACILCHPASGLPLSPQDAHLHPLLDAGFNPGLNVNLTAVTPEAGLTLDPGEKVAVTFSITDDSGADVNPTSLGSLAFVLNGPITNRNLIAYVNIPKEKLGATASSYTVNLPEPELLEFVGTAGNDGAIESFFTARFPHWNVGNSLTAVYERTATGIGTTLTADAAADQFYVDVLNSAGFARDNYVVLDDGVLGLEEYRQIALVDGNRLWFKTPYSYGFETGLRNGHLAGASIAVVTLTAQVAGTDYTLNAATGQITEVAANSFLAGNDIVCTYTTDFVLPAAFPPALNDSPDLDETWAKWAGLPIADGTYTIGILASRTLGLALYGETTNYPITTPPATMDFLVGGATTLDTYGLVSDSGAACYTCHRDMWFHGGGRRGFDACMLCHGTASSEDRPRYVAGNAPDTTRVLVEFRSMLHKIHKGEELAHADDWEVVGYGSAAWPNNFAVHTYGEVEFPARREGVRNCTKCHGDGNVAWMEPSDRTHPTSAVLPTREWRTVCNSCHDSDEATAHIDIMTSAGGVESCEVCHHPGADLGVDVMHKTR